MAWPNLCPDPSSIHEIVIKSQDNDQRVPFQWGDARVFGTASYWISQYLITYGQKIIANQNIGSNLLEEIIACLLGGYGVPAELGLGAFEVVKNEGLTSLHSRVSLENLEYALNRPIMIGKIKARYRFPKQRAVRILDAIEYYRENPDFPEEPHALREWLLRIKGIGMKTASWIVRNRTSSNKVAIIDIHIFRAGIEAGFFLNKWKNPTDYRLMEEAFIAFSEAGCVPASGLDTLIWSQMRTISRCNFVRKKGTVQLLAKTNESVPINMLFP